MVDGTGLENQQVNSFAGSNPVPSAKIAEIRFTLFSVFWNEEWIIILFYKKMKSFGSLFFIFMLY